jgi:hypothetical protein
MYTLFHIKIEVERGSFFCIFLNKALHPLTFGALGPEFLGEARQGVGGSQILGEGSHGGRSDLALAYYFLSGLGHASSTAWTWDWNSGTERNSEEWR